MEGQYTLEETLLMNDCHKLYGRLLNDVGLPSILYLNAIFL